MITLKSKREIELLKEAGHIVYLTHQYLRPHIKAGIKTKELDRLAEEFIRSKGATPSFKGYEGFPSTLCISINDEVVHGFPSDRVLQDGDIISIDCGTILNGFVGDSAYTFCVGEVRRDVLDLLKTTKESLYEGIRNAIIGHRIGDISNAVQTYCETRGYSVVRELVGHGIGRKMHEDPEVPNYGRKGSGPLLKAGMCICIEPMINMGTRHVVFEKDGWTVRTKDRKCSAHFEHCIAIREEGAQILSSFDYIDEILDNKTN